MTDRAMMLWRSDDAPHVRILGSIHYVEEALPDWVLEVHAGADAVVFEARLSGREGFASAYHVV
jgi:hypothetical protein